MDEQPKRRRGCLFYGCITGAVCLVAILIAALLGLHQVKKLLYQYTDDGPTPMPPLQMSPEQIERVRQRVEDFRDAVRTGRATSPLELSGDDINALIDSDPEFRQLKGKLRVAIEGSQLKGQLSLPLTELGLPRFKGRYLNGTASLGLSFQNGTLLVYAQELTVKGKPLPMAYMDAIRKQNLAQKIEEEPRAAAALKQLQDIQVKDGKLIITPKPPSTR